MRLVLILQILLAFSLSAVSQKISKPNYGLKTPSTAEIIWVDYRSDYTEVCVMIRNEIENGFFCIEKNTKLIKPDGNFVILKEVEGLPFCPDIYRFKKTGEEIVVRFLFPSTGNLSWFSLVEECSGGCLKFLGVTTDVVLNKEINNAYGYWESDGDLLKACNIFTGLLEKYDALNLGIEGLLYANVVELYNKLGNPEKAKEWHSRMLQSNAPDLKLYLENLKSKGINL